jgi:hypothetical protein
MSNRLTSSHAAHRYRSAGVPRITACDPYPLRQKSARASTLGTQTLKSKALARKKHRRSRRTLLPGASSMLW